MNEADSRMYKLSFGRDVRYLIWVVDNHGGFAAKEPGGVFAWFPSEDAALGYLRAHSDGSQITTATIECDVDAIIDENGVECSSALDLWNVADDVAQAGGLFFLGMVRAEPFEGIYDKLFFGCNLPSFAKNGARYEPVWSYGELSALASVLVDAVSFLAVAAGIKSPVSVSLLNLQKVLASQRKPYEADRAEVCEVVLRTRRLFLIRLADGPVEWFLSREDACDVEVFSSNEAACQRLAGMGLPVVDGSTWEIGDGEIVGPCGVDGRAAARLWELCSLVARSCETSFMGDLNVRAISGVRAKCVAVASGHVKPGAQDWCEVEIGLAEKMSEDGMRLLERMLLDFGCSQDDEGARDAISYQDGRFDVCGNTLLAEWDDCASKCIDERIAFLGIVDDGIVSRVRAKLFLLPRDSECEEVVTMLSPWERYILGVIESQISMIEAWMRDESLAPGT